MKKITSTSLPQQERSIACILTAINRERLIKVATVLTLLLQLIITGCKTTGTSSSHHLQQKMEVNNTAVANSGGRISLFLSLKTPDNQGVRLDVSQIDILHDDIWLPLTSSPLTINAAEIGSQQLFLGRCLLPPGQCRRLRFTLQQASILKNDGSQIFLGLDSTMVELDLPTALDLRRGDSQSLFITWDEETSLRTSPILKPTLSITPNLKQITTDLAYAACPEINTIYVLRTDKNWVCDSFGISGHPTCLTAIRRQSSDRLYILSPQDAVINVVAIPENNIINSFRIPMTTKPTFMTLSSDGSWAYILDTQNDYLLRMDMDSGNLDKRVRLGYQPEYATYINAHNLLAVGSTISQTISLLDANTFAKVGEIPTTGTPEGLLAWDNLLYICEGSANSVTVYDLNRRTILSRQNVGFFPHRLLQSDNQIYVSNRDSNSISIIHPRQLGIAREINLDGTPIEMAVEENSRWIYVGNKTIGGLSVIDATINRISSQILFGAVPMSLAVIQ